MLKGLIWKFHLRIVQDEHPESWYVEGWIVMWTKYTCPIQNIITQLRIIYRTSSRRRDLFYSIGVILYWGKSRGTNQESYRFSVKQKKHHSYKGKKVTNYSCLDIFYRKDPRSNDRKIYDEIETSLWSRLARFRWSSSSEYDPDKNDKRIWFSRSMRLDFSERDLSQHIYERK